MHNELMAGRILVICIKFQKKCPVMTKLYKLGVEFFGRHGSGKENLSEKYKKKVRKN